MELSEGTDEVKHVLILSISILFQQFVLSDHRDGKLLEKVNISNH